MEHSQATTQVSSSSLLFSLAAGPTPGPGLLCVCSAGLLCAVAGKVFLPTGFWLAGEKGQYENTVVNNLGAIPASKIGCFLIFSLCFPAISECFLART